MLLYWPIPVHLGEGGYKGNKGNRSAPKQYFAKAGDSLVPREGVGVGGEAAFAVWSDIFQEAKERENTQSLILSSCMEPGKVLCRSTISQHR